MTVKMTNFKEVFEEYSALGKARQGEEGHKESQVRDKLMEIVDAIGIDAKLLRNGDKFNSPLQIPETSVTFLVDVIAWHTSHEAKELRKAKFLAVPSKSKVWLISGFLDYLKQRGYDEKTIAHQRQRMEHRMLCSLQQNLDALSIQLADIRDHVGALRQSGASNFTYEDQVLFADFATKKVAELAEYLEEVACYVDEGRGEEIYESADRAVDNTSDAEIMERELRQERVFQAISRDDRYKRLEKERDALIEEEDFIKKKKIPYQKIVKEMQSIYDECEKSFFGDIMSEGPAPHFVLKPPHVALAEAIAYKKEADEERKRMLARPPISDEEQAKMRQCLVEHFGKDHFGGEKGEG